MSMESRVTFQQPMSILSKGEKLFTYDSPMRAYLDLSGLDLNLIIPHTGCYRGFFCNMEIIDGRLYVVKFNARCFNNGPLDLSVLFPGSDGKVFAHWFSGAVRAGAMEHKEPGPLSVMLLFTRNTTFRFNRGVLLP